MIPIGTIVLNSMNERFEIKERIRTKVINAGNFEGVLHDDLYHAERDGELWELRISYNPENPLGTYVIRHAARLSKK